MEDKNNFNENQNDTNQNDVPSDFSNKTEKEKNDLELKSIVQKQEQYKQMIQPSGQVNANFQDPYIWRIGFGRRLGGYIIDNVLLMLLFVVTAVITGLSERIIEFAGSDMSVLTSPDKMEGFSLFLTSSITPLMLAVTFIYYSLEVIFAQSIGKMLLGIQIGDIDKQFASYPKLILRFVLKFGSSVLTLLFLITTFAFIDVISQIWSFVFFIGCFFVLGAKKQALHDTIAKTAVYFKDELQQLNSTDERQDIM